MKRQRMWLVLLVLMTSASLAGIEAAQRDAPRRQEAAEVRVMGEVTAIHATRVFTVRERAGGRELLVLAPRPLRPGFVGATVTLEGTLRRLTDVELRRDIAIGELTGSTRDRLARGPVLVAHSVMAMSQPGAAPAVEEIPAPATVAPAQPMVMTRRTPLEERPIALRASMLLANLDVFDGRPVRLLNGHVVGVLEPGAFLIEPPTPYLKPMGQRDRVLVLTAPATLRAPEELFVGATVAVTGVVRTPLAIQVTREAPWPARLRPDVAERLEVRAVVLAQSVQTLDGTELTDRPSGVTGR